MKAIITVVGHDKVGIIAKVSGILAKNNVNILDISQTIMRDMFTMIMLVDVSENRIDFDELRAELALCGEGMELSINIQREDLFNSMHRI